MKMIKDFDKYIDENFGMDLPNEVNHMTETDSDSNMAKGQLKRTMDFAQMLIPMIDGMDDMEPWVQSKITKAEDYLNAVLNYYKGQEGVTEANSNTKNESVSEAKKVEVGTFVRYKKDKDFTGGKVISIKGSNVEIHNWDGSTSTLPLKDLEYVDSWNESVNEAKVTKKSVSKASDDLAKIIIQLKDNLGKLQSAKSDDERAKYIEIAKDLTQQRKDASAALDLAIAKLDKNAELSTTD